MKNSRPLSQPALGTTWHHLSDEALYLVVTLYLCGFYHSFVPGPFSPALCLALVRPNPKLPHNTVICPQHSSRGLGARRRTASAEAGGRGGHFAAGGACSAPSREMAALRRRPPRRHGVCVGGGGAWGERQTGGGQMPQTGSLGRPHVPLWMESLRRKNYRESLGSERAAVRTRSRRGGEHGGPAERLRQGCDWRSQPLSLPLKPERFIGGSWAPCRLSGAGVWEIIGNGFVWVERSSWALGREQSQPARACAAFMAWGRAAAAGTSRWKYFVH